MLLFGAVDSRGNRSSQRTEPDRPSLPGVLYLHGSLGCNLSHSLRCNLSHSLRCNLSHSLRCNLGHSLRCNLSHSLRCNLSHSLRCNLGHSLGGLYLRQFTCHAGELVFDVGQLSVTVPEIILEPGAGD